MIGERRMNDPRKTRETDFATLKFVICDQRFFFFYYKNQRCMRRGLQLFDHLSYL